MADPAAASPDPVSKDTRNLMRVLDHQGITLVFDVGANVGQYGQRLRRGGYAGRIVSVEPLSSAHAALSAVAAGDAGWTVESRLALGDGDTPVTLQVSGESDMSSVLDFTAEMADLLDGSAYVGTEVASQARLERIFPRHARPGDRVLLKIDTQGTEKRVLEGARGVLPRIAAVQMELSIVPVYAGEPSYRDMIQHMAELGFAPALFIPGYFNRRTARLIGMDGVFVRQG
jgi:FkbM family methyltransferase